MHFTGKVDYQMDDRNRVPIPPNFRGAFKDGGYVATGTGAFLVVYTLEAFDRTAAVLDALPPESDEAQDARRDFFANAWAIQPDGQGRMLLPPELIKYAGLGKVVKVVGNGTQVEIWDPATWDAREANRGAARKAAFNAAPAAGKAEGA